jgi:hypothetical protein
MGLLRMLFRLREIRQMLTECEWGSLHGHSDYGLVDACPYCRNQRTNEEYPNEEFGHTPTCPLNQMLDIIGRENDPRCEGYNGVRYELLYPSA